MKARLVESNRERMARSSAASSTSSARTCFTETEDSPLTARRGRRHPDPRPEVERERIEALEQWKAERDQAAVDAALEKLAEAARDESANIMPATIAAAKAGATTGEWAGTLREVFGDYRGPTGVGGAPPGARRGAARRRPRQRVEEVSEQIGHRMRILVGKPGLDGHSNGAEQIAVRARDVGMEVDLPGHPPDPRADRRLGDRRRTSTWSASRSSRARTCELVPEVVELLRGEGVDVPVVVGGIIPPADAAALAQAGVARRLHAEGLRPQPDHGRDRRAGRRARQRGLARSGLSGACQTPSTGALPRTDASLRS